MKILLALDPFGNSLKAIEEALIIAKQREADLVMIAIAETFQDTELTDIGMEGGREALMPLVEKSAEKARDIAIQKGITPKIIIKKGISPDTGILKCAEEEKADLIVMGHRKRTGLDLFILGSVTSKVVNNAHCSVFVVR
jgi:nucleotide-binding universal stress UspA family protein